MKNLLTIAFVTCDEYSDLWNNCLGLFQRFWSTCPYEVLFINNTQEVSWPGVKVLHAGDESQWSRRVQLALENCKTPYLCLLLEDFFIGAPINNIAVENALNIIKKYNLVYYKITNFSRAIKNRDPLFEKYSFLHTIFQDDDYGISVQPAIWEVNYFKKLLGPNNYNAWRFEFDRVNEASHKSHIPAVGCVFDEQNILHIKHALIQGKYVPMTVKYFQKLDIPLTIERPIMSWSSYYCTRFISKGKYLLPKPLRLPIKRFLEKCGMKFVSTIRDK